MIALLALTVLAARAAAAASVTCGSACATDECVYGDAANGSEPACEPACTPDDDANACTDDVCVPVAHALADTFDNDFDGGYAVCNDVASDRRWYLADGNTSCGDGFDWPVAQSLLRATSGAHWVQFRGPWNVASPPSNVFFSTWLWVANGSILDIVLSTSRDTYPTYVLVWNAPDAGNVMAITVAPPCTGAVTVPVPAADWVLLTISVDTVRNVTVYTVDNYEVAAITDYSCLDALPLDVTAAFLYAEATGGEVMLDDVYLGNVPIGAAARNVTLHPRDPLRCAGTAPPRCV